MDYCVWNVPIILLKKTDYLERLRMKRKSASSLVLLSCTVIIAVFIVLNIAYGAHTSKFNVPNEQGAPLLQAQQSNNNSETIAMEGQGEMMTANQDDSIVCNDFRIRVNTSSVSKKIDHLSKIDSSYYLADNPVVDEDNAFLDNHLYLEVGVEIENIGNKPEEINYMNFTLVWYGLLKNGESALLRTDLSVSSLKVDLSKNDAYIFKISPGDKREVYLGYILTEEDYQEAKKTLSLIPDLSGSSYMNPESVYRIKLDIDEEY